jgi:hypothetical protein
MFYTSCGILDRTMGDELAQKGFEMKMLKLDELDLGLSDHYCNAAVLKIA